MKTRALFIGLLLLPCAFAAAEMQDLAGRAHADEDTASDHAPPKPWLFETGHGLAFGRGRQTYNGLHAEDSVSTTARQILASGRLSENLEVVSNTNLQKGKLQEGDGNLTLGYKRHGFAVAAVGGMTYASVLFSKITLQEKIKTRSTLTYHYAVNVSEAITLDADSTWEIDFAAGYDDLGGVFRTSDLSAGLSKSIGDFDLEGLATGFSQDQNQTGTICQGKKSKACADSTQKTTLRGFGFSASVDWDLDPHLISIQAGVDWQAAKDTERIVLLGLGYAFSPTSWMDLGASIDRERNLDAKKNTEFWLAGSSISAHF